MLGVGVAGLGLEVSWPLMSPVDPASADPAPAEGAVTFDRSRLIV